MTIREVSTLFGNCSGEPSPHGARGHLLPRDRPSLHQRTWYVYTTLVLSLMPQLGLAVISIRYGRVDAPSLHLLPSPFDCRIMQRDRQVRSGSRIALDYKPQPPKRPILTHTRWFLAGLVLALLCGASIYLIKPPWSNETSVQVPALTAGDLPAFDLSQLIIPPKFPPPGSTLEVVVRAGDTLDGLFRRLNLSTVDLATIRALDGVRDTLDQLRTGEVITVVQEQGLIQSLQRRITESEVLDVMRTDSGFDARFIATPIEIRINRAHGEIESSLFSAAVAAGISAETIMRLANDIFGWKVDFALEIQPGDRFNLIYEQRFRDGRQLGDGQILAAEFINAGTVHRAIHYISGDAKISGYFDPEGRSVRGQFLRAPLDFTRISSNFNLKRRHPILDLIRAHRGVDYAAPTGTLIKAAGDGRVSFAGTQGGYGQVVIVEHGAGISTLYGHMSRFAKSVRSGKHVQQGQVIGYVGSTGAATGPHLHYEYRINGRHKNPRTVQLPDAKPIPSTYRDEFHAQRSAMLAELELLRESTVLASPATDR
jgi:murein DD-endopeptidase MepM/ murein hydrolase activator NlpD